MFCWNVEPAPVSVPVGHCEDAPCVFVGVELPDDGEVLLSLPQAVSTSAPVTAATARSPAPEAFTSRFLLEEIDVVLMTARTLGSSRDRLADSR
jgi:hypothetical protein